MKTFRCIICGEVFIGERRPANCPFCGVPARYMKETAKVDGSKIFLVKKLSDESRKNLMAALNLETSNASFYQCASEKSEPEELRIIFKRLARIENEHANVISRYLGLDSVELQVEECSNVDGENLTVAKERESHALEFYKQAMAEARESKIASFFRALIDVEEGHLEVVKKF